MDLIEQAISRASDTKAAVIGKGAISKTPEMFRKLFGDKKAIVVADVNTYAVVGKNVMTELSYAGIETVSPYIFTDPDLYAEWGFLTSLEQHLAGIDAIAVAVGSGVINDLTKLASHRLGRRYMIVGTAASMDGYTAYGASVSFEGNKQTFDCRAPLGIVFDPVVAAGAPKDLAASGYADLIAKVPAAADWMIADELAVEPIDDFAFSLVQDNLRKALADPEAVFNGDVQATSDLAEGLIMSGFAMQAIQSSRPASGVEHQYSHYWDMENLCIDGRHVSHGFKVGIGTLVSTASLEFLLGFDMASLDVDKCVAQWPEWEQMAEEIARMCAGNDGLLSRCLTESRAKYIDRNQLRAQLNRLVECWPHLKQRIADQILPYDDVFDRLRKVHAPYLPAMINIDREHLRTTYRAIPYMRSRFTHADIVLRCGLLNQLEEYLFDAPGHKF